MNNKSSEFNDEICLISDNDDAISDEANEQNSEQPPETVIIPVPENLNCELPSSSPSFDNSTVMNIEVPPTTIITCEVCQTRLNITGKENHKLFKCAECKETTPFGEPSPGYKYFRCPCKKLLIHKIESNLIVCPDSSCNRTINLNTNIVTSPTSGTSRVRCGYCEEIFIFDISNKILVRCPHCEQISSIGSNFARTRSILYLLAGLIFSLLGVVVVVQCYKNSGKIFGINFIYITLQCVFLSIIMFSRCIYFWFMTISEALGPLQEEEPTVTRF